MNRHLAMVFFCVVVGFGLGCENRQVSYRAVPIEGLPHCDQRQGVNPLKRPLLLDIRHGGGELRQHVAGIDERPTVSLAMRKDRLKVRVGVCQELTQVNKSGNWVAPTCDQPSWLAEAQEITVDPREPDAKIVVKLSGDHVCSGT